MAGPEEPIDRADPRGLTYGVVTRITALVVSGLVRPGDKLPPESALMEQYAVSRTVIREAISRLQAAGLVATYRGKGSYILTRPVRSSFTTDPTALRTVDDAVELLDFRLGCEVEAAALAAQRRSEAQLARLAHALAVSSTSAAKPSAAADADFQFHLAIAEAANNRYFVDLLASLGPTMIAMPGARLVTVDADSHRNRFERVVQEHENIFAAIERRDPQGAGAATRTHLANSRARLQ